VLAALGEAVWSELGVGSVKCTIDGTVVCALNYGTVGCALNDGTVVCALNDGMVIIMLDDGTVACAHDDGTVVCALQDGSVTCALDNALFLIIFLQVDIADMLCTVEVSAVAGDMI
jgi:translation initiation factor IF-1